MNRSTSSVPLSARRVQKIPKTYPLTYELYDAEDRLLCSAGLPFDKKTLSKVKRILKAKPEAEELETRVGELEELFEGWKAEFPEAAPSLTALTEKKPAGLNSYKDFRKKVLGAFAAVI